MEGRRPACSGRSNNLLTALSTRCSHFSSGIGNARERGERASPACTRLLARQSDGESDIFLLDVVSSPLRSPDPMPSVSDGHGPPLGSFPYGAAHTHLLAVRSCGVEALMSTRPMVFSVALALLGCAPDDEARPAAQRSTARLDHRVEDPSSETAPEDETPACGDGSCDAMRATEPSSAANATTPTRRDDPDRCAVPLTDCPCISGTPAVACDVDTNGPVTPRTCYIGQRDCEESRWGRCRAYRPRFQ